MITNNNDNNNNSFKALIEAPLWSASSVGLQECQVCSPWNQTCVLIEGRVTPSKRLHWGATSERDRPRAPVISSLFPSEPDWRSNQRGSK